MDLKKDIHHEKGPGETSTPLLLLVSVGGEIIYGSRDIYPIKISLEIIPSIFFSRRPENYILCMGPRHEK